MAKFHIPDNVPMWRYHTESKEWEPFTSSRAVAYEPIWKWSEECGHYTPKPLEIQQREEAMKLFRLRFPFVPTFFVLPLAVRPYLLIAVKSDYVGLQLLDDAWMEM